MFYVFVHHYRIVPIFMKVINTHLLIINCTKEAHAFMASNSSNTSHIISIICSANG